MSIFDMAIGLDATAMNQACAAVYKQMYPKLFTGSEKVTFGGGEITLSYDVKTAPTFVLSPPENVSTLIQSHLKEANIADTRTWTLKERQEAIETAVEGNIFQILMNDFDLTIDTGEGPPATDKLEVTVVTQASSTGGKLSLIPLKATAKTSNPADQALVNKFMVPKALEIMTTLLNGISLPPLEAPGIALTPPNLFVQNERLIAVANRQGGPIPPIPTGVTWPTESFFAVLSPELRTILAANASGQIHWSGSYSGSSGTNLGGVSYSASASITKASVIAEPNNPTGFVADAQVSGNVSAEVKVLCIPTGVSYALSTNPHPIGAEISASISGKTVVATVRNVSSVTIILTPSGNVAEKILSAITWPITQAVVAAFSPAILGAIRGVSFPILTVSDFPYSTEGVNLIIGPSNLSLKNWNNYLAVVGRITIS